MILVDTSIIIEFWKKPSAKVKKIFLKEDVAVCGIVKAELIHGAKNKKQQKIIQEALNDFAYVITDESIWADVGNLLYDLRKQGITIPFQDAVLCSLALKHDLVLWSNDKHFNLIKEKVDQLKLFKQGK